MQLNALCIGCPLSTVLQLLYSLARLACRMALVSMIRLWTTVKVDISCCCAPGGCDHQAFMSPRFHSRPTWQPGYNSKCAAQRYCLAWPGCSTHDCESSGAWRQLTRGKLTRSPLVSYAREASARNAIASAKILGYPWQSSSNLFCERRASASHVNLSSALQSRWRADVKADLKAQRIVKSEAAFGAQDASAS